MTKISVIILSHNRPQYLKTAIESMFSQTISNWELIIIDDASTNPGVDTVLAEARKDRRVRVFKEPKNINNLAVLWNKALDVAQGEYIGILDDDNKKAPEFCEKMTQYLDHHKEYDVVACLQWPIDEKNKIIPGPFRSPLEANKENILKRNYVDGNESVFRKQLFDRVGYFDERLSRLEDWDMFVRIFYETNGIAILPEKLGYYRLHKERRMFQGWEMEEENITFARKKNEKRGGKLKISCIYPTPERLTWTQQQVCKGVQEALPKIPFVSFLDNNLITSYNSELLQNSDFILLISPFRIAMEEMEKLAKLNTPIVTMHLEDPQIVTVNAERAKFASWVVSNDVAAIPYYGQIIDPKRILFCPSLSISEDVFNSKGRWKEKFDVTFCGYAYDSRVDFMRSFLDGPMKFKLLILGDDWVTKLGAVDNGRYLDKLRKDNQIQFMYAKGELNTMKIYRSSKIIVCTHRTHQDLGGFPAMPPKSVQRGYIEAYSGALVMIDAARPQISFGPNEIVRFVGPNDLKAKIKYYLAHPRERRTRAKKAQMRAKRDFTFTARLTKVLNCLRSERYGMKIP